MPTPILATKLYIPPLRPNLVARPRLLARMDAGAHGRLTLVSATAGFGKSTLVSTWIAARDQPAAWLALDPDDGEPTRFLVYVIAALQTVAPDLGAAVLARLQSPQPPDATTALTALLNEIAAVPTPFTLVLDDYHVVDNSVVDDALTFLLDYLPPQMHLVITTREDPPLPLTRLRARGQLTEIRAGDLRFTVDEAAAFLNLTMGLTLSVADVAALDARTEGWIAGLQLAALSMQGRGDVHGFVQAFAGDNRYVVDYLVDEVLTGRPAPVRDFLLQTSILERLTGALCDALTGRDDGHAQLVALERDNLFVIPLDETRAWFRYHHLFADVLRAHLRAEQPAQLPVLHGRAARWYAAHDEPAIAIRHALAAEDFPYAATLIEREWHSMDATLQSDAWLRWVQALPDDVVQTRPVLSLGYGWALLNAGDVDAAETHLRDAERWLDPASTSARRDPDRMVVVDQAIFDKLAASIAAARAYAAQARGDADTTVAYARQALDLLPADDDVGRRVPAAILGLGQWHRGELDAAYRTLSAALASFEHTGHIPGAVSGAYGLADIRSTLGRLHDAAAVFRHALDMVAEIGDPVFPGVAESHVGLGEIHLEWGDLDAAIRHMEHGRALGEEAVLPGDAARLYTVMARIEYARGDADAAHTLLDEADRVFIQSPAPNVRPVAAWKARYRLCEGNLAQAQRWAQARGIAVDDDLHYLTEFEHVTLARLLLAQGRTDTHRLDEAVALLDRLLTAAEAGGRTGSVIEISALQALAHQAAGDTSAALSSLARALTPAAAEGYVHIFVAEGTPMSALLRAAVDAQIAPDYAAHLLTFMDEAAPVPPVTAPAAQDLVEPLSDRELDVLRLLATDLTGPEIADELVISLNTMRTHTKNIYGKLAVNSRRAAVRRAQELDLL